MTWRQHVDLMRLLVSRYGSDSRFWLGKRLRVRVK